MELKDFFERNKRAALAFSGGADSAYLLYAAVAAGAEIGVYYVKTQFQPEFETRDALRLASALGVEPVVIRMNALESEQIAANPAERCYHCKKRIMGAVKKRAAQDGFTLIIDGTNASDDAGDRPGMRALREEGVRSPLRECGLTKAEIRRRSKEAGLFTWDKPAYACLATRIPTGERITAEKLQAVEEAEDYLMGQGYADFRVRLRDGSALLQVTDAQMEKARQELAAINEALGGRFAQVTLDPIGRKKST